MLPLAELAAPSWALGIVLCPVGPAGQKPSVKRCSRKTLGMWEMGSHRVPEPLLWEVAYKKTQRGVKS